jgi:hypothetical protein
MLGVALATLLAQAAQAPRDPLDILATLEDDLRKATRAPADQRDRLRRAARDAFEREVERGAPRIAKAAWDHFFDYLTKLGMAERVFSDKDERQERDLWVACCKTALLKLVSQCRESKAAPADQPSTSELFNATVDAVTRVKNRFIGDEVNDLRISAYDALNQVFRQLVRRARAPQGDPKNLYTGHIVTVDRRFLLASDMERKANDVPNRLLKDVARACLDRALAASR